MVVPAPMCRREGPYRSPGRVDAPGDGASRGWVVCIIDTLVVLGIAGAVLMVPRWPALVDVAAHGFLGF